MSTQKVKFSLLDERTFKLLFPEAAELREEGLPRADLGVRKDAVPGQLLIPGYGFHACLVQDGKPIVFFEDDEGWLEVPSEGVEFILLEI